MKTTSLVCALALSAIAFGPGAVAAETKPAAEPGDLWDVTTTMSMEGMNIAMPAQTQRVCAAREWTKPPMGDDDRSKCETLEFKNTPTRSTWKVRCAGPPAMTGEGEITRSGPDAYKGWMKMTSSEGVVTMTMTGRRVGDCDAAEQKRKVARMVAEAEAGQKMAADAQKQACLSPVESLDLRMLKMQGSYCTDPAIKTAFCGRLGTPEAFKLLCERGEKDPENSLAAIAAYCDRDPAAITKERCRIAREKEDLDVLGRCCVDGARELALRECAGRKYTSLTGSKYQAFCAQYARDVMAGGEHDPTVKNEQEPKKEEEPETGTAKAKKLLKGIFKR